MEIGALQTREACYDVRRVSGGGGKAGGGGGGLPECFGNFELLRFTGPKKQSGVLGAQLFHRRYAPGA